MANLKEVKNRIQSVQSTQQITSAMKMVAAAKLKKAQDKSALMKEYTGKLSSIVSRLTQGTESESLSNGLGDNRDCASVLLVVVSSDRGLCGGFNNNVFKSVVNLIKKEYSYEQKTGGLHVLPVGKKSFEYFSKRDYNVIGDHADVIKELSYDRSKEASSEVINNFLDKKFDRVILIYNEFKNVATQIIKTEQFLPISVDSIQNDSKVNADFLYEPTIDELLKTVVPDYLHTVFYNAMLESNVSEHGARMTAMNQATDNAGELLKELKLTYNRTRQAAITKEILEIVGGAEALASS